MDFQQLAFGNSLAVFDPVPNPFRFDAAICRGSGSDFFPSAAHDYHVVFQGDEE